MRRLLRSLTQAIGLTRPPGLRRASAERPLRLLAVGSLVLPVIVFAIAAEISYNQHFDDARDRLVRNLNRVTEHAIKVFETFELSAIYLDQVLGDTPNDEIRRNESAYNAKLKTVATSLPQLRDLWVVDAEGHPVVSGTVYPMPHLELADRDYFRVHNFNRGPGAYISEIMQGRVGTSSFFVISRRREISGQFAGITIVSIAPEYFYNYYSSLPVTEDNSASLVRTDGAVLVRYPDVPGSPARLGQDSLFMRTVRASPDFGFVENRSAFDGMQRTFAYRKLPKYDVFISTSFANNAVVADWIAAMSRHLIFGFPATLAMFGLSLIALKRAQRLQAEVTRREATEQALRQSQKMEAVGRLSGGIAHDFNNMLTIILGNIDIALQRIGGDNPRVQRALQAARQGSERAAMLVQRLLAFSRQHPLEVKAVDTNRLVHDMSELLRRTIGETTSIETVLAGGLWRIAVDPNQLENAIVNLAVNARDAMPDGGRLTIETANSYLDEAYTAAHGGEVVHGQYVMIAVSDTGTGMSREIMEKAFEPFFTTKPTGMGTGLGLSMVYGFAKQSGGHVKIYSEAGEGTTIKLYFPRLSEQRNLPDWSEEDRAPSKSKPRGGTETILLVEDDGEVRRFASETLRELGYTVHAAPEGATALEILDSTPQIQMLFTDVVLPNGMNGRQLADEALRRRPGLKVLYATGYTRNAIIHHGRLDSDVELLSKPFTANELARKVRAILDSSPTASAK
jgi:two-component system NtrC family sensor kinase